MKLFKISAIILLAIILFLFGVFIYLLRPIGGDIASKEIIITKGQSRSQIAQRLADEKLVRSQFAFFLYLRVIKANILPGVYEIAPSESASSIAQQLAEGQFKTARITLIEGWRATDIETYLLDKFSLTQFEDFAEKAEQYEGYLFPDTYEIKIDTTTEELIELLRGTFAARTKDLSITNETVNLAAIVQREAANIEEMPEIAEVYLNRLAIGMRLEADATVQYAKGNWKSVTVSDYRNVVSPYNTYLNDGLPPAPIANPGFDAIRAVLAPAEHDYLFYFHAQGKTFFSKTHAEHRAKVAQYF